MTVRWEDRWNAAEAWYMRRFFLQLGIWMIAMGGMSLVLPVVAAGASPKVGDVLYGLCFVGFGVYMIRSPAAWMARVLCAIWAVWFVMAARTAWKLRSNDFMDHAFLVMLFCMVIVVCVFLYRKYRRFLAIRTVDPGLAEETDRLIRGVMRRRPSVDTDTAGLVTRFGRWKIGLLDGEVLMVSQFGSDLCLAQQHEVRWDYEGDPLADGRGRIILKLGARRWKGRMASSHYRRLEDWLSGGSVPD